MASDSLFQVTGVSSGIAWDEIISKIVENAQKPATQWQNRIDSLEVKKTLYQDLQTQFNTLRNTLTKLRLSSAYNTKKAEYTSYSANNVDPEKIVTAKIDSTAELNWWDVEVKNLARAQRHMSSRVGSVSEALGLEGDFMIRVGKQYATISVSSSDTLRDINYNISKAVDQEGNAMAVTAKILDNRLVIESATAGKGNSGDTRGVSLTMTKSNEYYLPHASTRDSSGKYVYPPQLVSLSYEDPGFTGSYTYNYEEGADFTYDSSTGKITWIENGKKPPEGATFNAVYSEWVTVKRDESDSMLSSLSSANGGKKYDYLPLLPTGEAYDTSIAENFSIIGGGVEYKQGVDFNIVSETLSDGNDYQLIEWVTAPPSDGTALSVRIGANTGYTFNDNVFYLEPAPKYSAGTTITRGGTGASLPGLPSDMDLLPANLLLEEYKNAKFEITGSDGITKYKEGTDFEIEKYTDTGSGQTYDVVKWLKAPTSTFKIRAVVENDYGKNSVLAGLGFITPAADGFPVDQWSFTEGNYTNASNAEFEIDGVPITRDTNTIDDVIADVTLELTGLGQVRVNIVRDLEETVEGLQTFVDAYNKVLEWINYYISEKEDATNAVDETDHLSSILQESKGNTVYGVLHGDQLLWSIKNQMRSRLGSPITTLASSLATRSVVNTTDAMSIKGSFYIYLAGKAARIDIEPTDSLEDIQDKLTSAGNIYSSNGFRATGGDMGLSVNLVNGQLVIDAPLNSSSSSALTTTATLSEKITRSSASYDYLPFLPETSAPVNGALRVYSGSKEYQEGTDFRLVTETVEDSNGDPILTSRIEWYDVTKAPTSSYYVNYTYAPGAISYSFAEGSGPTVSEIAKGCNDLSMLDLHHDMSKLSLSNMGMTTESTDKGKSGYVEFDSEAFLAIMESDPDIAGGAMLSFMRDFDTYIGNLVDSSQMLVAGQVVTKGRIATALNTIDSEQSTLNDRITKLNKQLEEKQTALYKQYSNMEVAIQKLNAQMSSLSSFLTNMNSSS
ncbi:MAG: flagellar filament capping protein FliD [Synergistaceae bacterium]|jgi:flagellar capping protein FliD|nr:flagellar filament capping protein FliD [Synergistaceae bacterium]